MSPQPTSPSDALESLEADGYSYTVVDERFLVVNHIPYVTAERTVAYGKLVSVMNIAGDVLQQPNDHLMRFIGALPHEADGEPLNRMFVEASPVAPTAELTTNYTLSQKLADEKGQPRDYSDEHEKVVTYVSIFEDPARKIDPEATATIFESPEELSTQSVFQYPETASSRAGVNDLSDRLAMDRVAIVGAGGTGSYVIDFVAKTPVKEIHIFDNDVLVNHNAFRAPGATSKASLSEAPPKVEYFEAVYSNMHKHLIAHTTLITEANVEVLREMNFVFLCMDGAPIERLVAERLIEWEIPSVSVGTDIKRFPGGLDGMIRTTMISPENPADLSALGGGAEPGDDIYASNIQIAELNALNAAAAVIKWKKFCGFYADDIQESESLYTIGDNDIAN